MPGGGNSSLDEIGRALRAAGRIALVCHVRPDGDAIGSLSGLARSLRLAGKDVIALSEDGVPGNLAFLPDSERITQPGKEPLAGVDVAVVLDTATQDRMGAGCAAALGGAALMVNLDHHITNPRFGDLNLVDTGAPATGQIVYELLASQGLPVDDGVLQNLFAAISTDTGSFQFSCTTPRTHEIVAEMMRAGLDTARLARLLYQSYPRRRLELLRAMLNEMRFHAQDRIVSWILTRRTMEEVQMEDGDTEGLIDTLRAVESVIAAVIFEELADGKIRVSARSKDARFNVSEVCQQFGGGGHAMAAGARLRGPASEAAERFITAMEVQLGRFA